MSFFDDVFGDSMISAGRVKVEIIQTTYVRGEVSKEVVRSYYLNCPKSTQPLEPAEVKMMGFGDYDTNEYRVLYTVKEIPLPTGSGATTMVTINGKQYYVRKVLPWVWDEHTSLAMGAYKVIVSRYSEATNPNV